MIIGKGCITTIDREGISYFGVSEDCGGRRFTAVIFNFYVNLVVPKWIPAFYFRRGNCDIKI